MRAGHLGSNFVSSFNFIVVKIVGHTYKYYKSCFFANVGHTYIFPKFHISLVADLYGGESAPLPPYPPLRSHRVSVLGAQGRGGGGRAYVLTGTHIYSDMQGSQNVSFTTCSEWLGHYAPSSTHVRLLRHMLDNSVNLTKGSKKFVPVCHFVSYYLEFL